MDDDGDDGCRCYFFVSVVVMVVGNEPVGIEQVEKMMK